MEPIKREIPSFTGVSDIMKVLGKVWKINRSIYILFSQNLEDYLNRSIPDEQFQEIIDAMSMLREKGWLTDGQLNSCPLCGGIAFESDREIVCSVCGCNLQSRHFGDGDLDRTQVRKLMREAWNRRKNHD